MEKTTSATSRGQSIFTVISTGMKLWWYALPRLFPLTLVLILVSAFASNEINRLYLHGKFLEQALLLQSWGIVILYFLLLFVLVPAIFHQLIYFSEAARPNVFFSLWKMLKRYHHFVTAFVLMLLSVVLGFICLLIPGLILLVTLQFYLPMMLLTEKGPFDSYHLTCDLVWGYWWRSFFVLLIASLIIFFSGYCIEQVLIFILKYFRVEMRFIIAMSIKLAISAIFLPLFFAVTFVQVSDLKKRESIHNTPFDRWLAYLQTSWENS